MQFIVQFCGRIKISFNVHVPSTIFLFFLTILFISKQIYVLFPNDEKVGMKHIKKYVELMKSENVPRAILVVQQPLTPFAKTHLQELSPKFHLEVFLVSDQVHLFLLTY